MFYFEEVTSTVLKIRVEFTFATQQKSLFRDFFDFIILFFIIF